MPNLATTIVQLRIATVVMVVAGKGSHRILRHSTGHLFRKQHPCGSVCSAGICEIQISPQAIEFTSTGGRERYVQSMVSGAMPTPTNGLSC